jgi:hypothetical protein
MIQAGRLVLDQSLEDLTAGGNKLEDVFTRMIAQDQAAAAEAAEVAAAGEAS